MELVFTFMDWKRECCNILWLKFQNSLHRRAILLVQLTSMSWAFCLIESYFCKIRCLINLTQCMIEELVRFSVERHRLSCWRVVGGFEQSRCCANAQGTLGLKCNRSECRIDSRSIGNSNVSAFSVINWFQNNSMTFYEINRTPS